MDVSLQVSNACAADAGIISRIIEQSIRLGCAIDHRNDPQIVDTWTRTKTLEHIEHWFRDSRLYLSLARLQDKPVGVAMAATNGRLAFCYVQPQWFRRGVGRALVRDLETWLGARGLAQVHLNSTRTSEAFYQRLGYCHAAPSFSVAGLQAIPMYRELDSVAGKADRGAKS